MRSPVLHGLAASVLLAGASASGAGSRLDRVDPSAAAGGYDGATVLWGGRIFARKVDTDGECLEIAALPLRAGDARPTTNVQREGQHFIACGGHGFVSGAHSVGSFLTVAGSVRGVEERVLPRSCGYATYDNGRIAKGSLRATVEHGCALKLPVVDAAHSRSWREKPSRTGFRAP